MTDGQLEGLITFGAFLISLCAACGLFGWICAWEKTEEKEEPLSRMDEHADSSRGQHAGKVIPIRRQAHGIDVVIRVDRSTFGG